ncbi:hypothetical protein [Pseudomonas syringae group genomosp. 3]|uniref:hypothetical protein n=1 Tax=Pseudomonas syringae group genomosp. 3 TaxID=251701 RepID=UPI000EFFE2D7|nr:hypothetical protein [Pseudomonas syringae group genomosp. 3]
MKLNRELQLDILKRLEATYPLPAENMHRLFHEPSEAAANIYYLSQHDLVDAEFSKTLGQSFPEPIITRINHRGMDFLADDGGLSAILGVVTVKLHEDTIKSLVEAKVADSDLPQDEKDTILSVIRGLPAEATKRLTEKLLDLGMENLPVAGHALRTFLQGLGGS